MRTRLTNETKTNTKTEYIDVTPIPTPIVQDQTKMVFFMVLILFKTQPTDFK